MISILKFLFFLFVSMAASAQTPYPNRAIRFVMAYPPAGSSDVLARPIANEMTKGLGQPVLLEYKPGAGSTIAADFTAKSPPDGYTIVLLLTAHAVNATLMPKKSAGSEVMRCTACSRVSTLRSRTQVPST